MGTRATVKFKEGNNILVNVYHQYDGYLRGVGLELANFLNGIEIVNGLRDNATFGEIANGMGCLASQYIASIKTQAGGVYIESLDCIEEYDYIVELIEGKLIIKVDEFTKEYKD